MITILPFAADKADEVTELFHLVVHSINPDIYSAEQQEVWAPTPPDYKYWAARLMMKRPWLAMVENQVVGFIELEPSGLIDCLYVHPDFQGQGVASALYHYVLTESKLRGIACLSVDASIIAKPFFLQHGFVQLAENKIQRKGITLINFAMEKRLSSNQ